MSKIAFLTRNTGKSSKNFILGTIFKNSSGHPAWSVPLLAQECYLTNAPPPTAPPGSAATPRFRTSTMRPKDICRNFGQNPDCQIATTFSQSCEGPAAFRPTFRRQVSFRIFSKNSYCQIFLGKTYQNGKNIPNM
jgi:hypothetical protein